MGGCCSSRQSEHEIQPQAVEPATSPPAMMSAIQGSSSMPKTETSSTITTTEPSVAKPKRHNEAMRITVDALQQKLEPNSKRGGEPESGVGYSGGRFSPGSGMSGSPEIGSSGMSPGIASSSPHFIDDSHVVKKPHDPYGGAELHMFKIESPPMPQGKQSNATTATKNTE